MSISESIWNKAYDGLKGEKPKLVEAYEKLVSEQMDKGKISTEGLQLDDNSIEQKDTKKRRLQMEQLVNFGKDETERERKIKEGVGSALKGILLFKDLVGQVVSTMP